MQVMKTYVYLSDRDLQSGKRRHQSWQYLVVWADESGEKKGFHTNFKLSKSGEVIVLSNVSYSIGMQTTNVSQGRLNSSDGKLGDPSFSQSKAEIGLGLRDSGVSKIVLTREVISS